MAYTTISGIEVENTPASGLGTGVTLSDTATGDYSIVIVGTANSASYSVSSSYAQNGGTGGSGVSSSYALRATSASYAPGNPSISASYAVSASYAPSLGGGGTTLTTGSFYPITASWARSASYYPPQTYQPNTTSASFASSSVSSSIASRIAGGATNYIAKWSDNTTLTASNIIDDNSTVSFLKNVKHTGSLYKDYWSHTIPESTHNNKWLRIAQFNSSELSLDNLSGYLSPSKLKILAVPVNQAGASNRGNYAEVSVINAGFGGAASIAVTNAYTYGGAIATKLRTSKSGSLATWYIDVYIENISASATTDTLQVTLLDGRMSLVSELDPVVAYTPTETSILYPGVHSTTQEYGFRVEGNDLFVSASSNPLRLLGVQSASDSEFLSIDSTGVVRKGSTVPTSSFAHKALNAVFASSSLSASYAPGSPSVSSSYAVSASYAPSSPSVSASYATSASYSDTGGNYVLSFQNLITITPADSTTYFVGPTNFRTLFNQSAILIPKGGRITSYWVRAALSGGAGSSEVVNYYLRLNDTTDVGQIRTTWDTAYSDINSGSMSQPVVSGDYVALKVVTPAWVSNPSAVYVNGYINITT